MTKTCYFCERFWLCMEVYNTNPSSKHCVHPDPYAQFIPNDEWKEIEQLEKENEELKRKIQSYKYEREKLHGYLAKSEVKE